MQRCFSSSTLLAVLLASPLLAQETTVYTVKEEFLDRLSPGYYFNDFQSFPSGDQGATNMVLSGGTPVLSFTLSTGGDLNNLYVASGTLPSGKAISTTVESKDLLLIFTNGNVTAVGGNFFLSDLAENQTSGPLTITLSDGTLANFTSPSNGPVEFRGFTTGASNPITLLTLHANSQYVTIDDLYVGTVTAATNTVPVALTIRPVNSTQIEVSWPMSALGYVLRTKLDLSSGSWMDAVGIDVPSDGFHHVVISTAAVTRFFQLQKP